MAEREDDEALGPELTELPELIGLIRTYRAAQPACPLDALARPDAPTQAALDWLTASWRALEPRAAALPFALRLRGRGVQTALRGFAAAAILLVLFTLAFQRPGTRSSAPSGAAETDGPRIAAITRDLTEIRSGPVRLLLFSDTQKRQQP